MYLYLILTILENYNNARRALSQSGAGTKIKCPYFDELQEIFGHKPVSIQAGIDSTNVKQCQNSEIQSSNIINLEMYDNISDPFDGSVPSTSHDIGMISSKIKNPINIDTNVVDTDNNNCEISKNANITIDKINNIDKGINISSDNINKVNLNKVNNNNNETDNETKPKIEMNIKKKNSVVLHILYNQRNVNHFLKFLINVLIKLSVQTKNK